MELLTFIIALVLICLPFFDWTASIILHRAAKKAGDKGIAVHERARMATVLAIATSINGLLGVNRVFVLGLAQPVTLILLSIALILISVPNIYWLILYRRHRIKKD